MMTQEEFLELVKKTEEEYLELPLWQRDDVEAWLMGIAEPRDAGGC